MENAFYVNCIKVDLKKIITSLLLRCKHFTYIFKYELE